MPLRNGVTDSARNNATSSASDSISSGIGLRSAHYRDIFDVRPELGFVEVHSENFLGRDAAALAGPAQHLLTRVRNDYALSLHGIGLSLGSAQAPLSAHLQQLKMLADTFEPLFISDHLAWVGIDGVYANDLLPLPYTEESLRVVDENIDATQQYLGRQLLIENPSRYLDFSHSTIAESEFLNALVQRTGCGLLLDVNNVFVSATNLNFDAHDFIAALDAEAVQEIHLAGFSETAQGLIDSHSAPVDARVWSLYEYALRCVGDKPTLIEWDAQLPALAILLAEKDSADQRRQRVLESSEVANDVVA
ncbi:MAG: hypothetical protein JWM78_1723 [Verrucomicrobiaceae bacterium]|nr:hypothetical protein [Verrucomicrobiaceae bacterium]